MTREERAHFDDKSPVVTAIYVKLIAAIEKLGKATVEPHKTSIHLVRKTALAGVATRKDHLVLTLKSDHPIVSKRIHRSQQTSRSRYHHEVKLTSPKDVDKELSGWLKEAWELSA